VTSAFGIVPIGRALGAEIRGVDLRVLGPEELHTVRAAWQEHQVLLFREQSLTLEDLLRFSLWGAEIRFA
jgi:taurine dioxygenase